MSFIKRHLSASIIRLAVVALLGAFLFAYDTGAGSGGPGYIAQTVNLGRAAAAAALASLLAGVASSRLVPRRLVRMSHRRWAGAAGSCVFAFLALASAYSPSLAVLCLVRYVLGVCVGVIWLRRAKRTRSVGPGPFRRLMIPLGLLSTYAVLVSEEPSHGWRWLLGLASIPAVAVLTTRFTPQESGRPRRGEPLGSASDYRLPGIRLPTQRVQLAVAASEVGGAAFGRTDYRLAIGDTGTRGAGAASPAPRRPGWRRVWRGVTRLLTGRGAQSTAMLAVAAAVLALGSSVREAARLTESLGRSDAAAALQEALGEQPQVDMRTATPRQAYGYLRSNFRLSDGFLAMRRFSPFIPLWGNTLALDTYAALMSAPGPHQQEYRAAYDSSLAALSYYWGHASGGGRSGYFPHVPLFFHERGLWDDDNAWIGLAMMHAYRLERNPAWLAAAEKVFALLVSQWDPHGGGIYWQVQLSPAASHERSAVSNAPVATLGAELYQATGDARYLEWAETIFAWTNRVLFDRASGLYSDHIGGGARVNATKWTYVQGVELQAMGALSEVAPQKYPIQRAIRLAERSLRYFSYCSTPDRVPEFRAVYLKDLLWLSHLRSSPRLQAGVRRCLANAVNRLPRDPALLRHAAGAAYIVALNALPRDDYGRLG